MSTLRPIGFALGALTAPVFALGSLLRRARVFHPVGTCWTARVDVIEGIPTPLRAVAAGLAGPARVRLSGGVWKSHEAPRDILGVAVRFGESVGSPSGDDLDLLFATFRTLPGLLPALFTTDGRDFFANTYWTAMPFRIGDARGTFRCVPARSSGGGHGRLDRLRRAVDGTATFRIDAIIGATVTPLLHVTLDQELPDQPRLHFAPWRAARNVTPIGLVAGMRRFAYPCSQWARSKLGR